MNDNYRACGVMSNRSYNYYTQGNGLPCTDNGSQEFQDEDNLIYLTSTDFPYTDIEGDIKIPNMGLNKEYKIDWINALTGDYIITTLENTGLFSGNLELNYPGTLTGDETQPILFFQIYRADETSFKTPIQSGGSNMEVYELKLMKDSSIVPIEITEWKTRESVDRTDEITLSPNPTRDIVKVSLNQRFINVNAKWFLADDSSMILQQGKIVSTNYTIDLSVRFP